MKFDEMDEDNERLETFCVRFTRLQDYIGDKLIPVLLYLIGEPYKPFCYRLGQAEKLDWLVDTENFFTIRSHRNLLVHEYLGDSDEFLFGINEAISATPYLCDIVERITSYEKKISVIN